MEKNKMEDPKSPGDDALDPRLVAAVRKIETFVEQTTGEPPTVDELAPALTKYFVLKEIKEYIEMERLEGGDD